MAGTLLHEQRMDQSLLVLSNATELAVVVVSEITGNDISDSLNGARLSMDTIRTLAQPRFKQILEAQK